MLWHFSTLCFCALLYFLWLTLRGKVNKPMPISRDTCPQKVSIWNSIISNHYLRMLKYSGAFWILKYLLFFPNITFDCVILLDYILNTIPASVGEPMSLLKIVSILAQSTSVSIQLKWGLTGCAIFKLEVISAPLVCWWDHKLLLLSIPEQAISLCSSFLNFWWVMLQPS